MVNWGGKKHKDQTDNPVKKDQKSEKDRRGGH